MTEKPELENGSVYRFMNLKDIVTDGMTMYRILDLLLLLQTTFSCSDGITWVEKDYVF